MAEWLRRWTRNPLGSARAGSNPADYDHFFSPSSLSFSLILMTRCVTSGTHQAKQATVIISTRSRAPPKAAPIPMTIAFILPSVTQQVNA